MEWTRLPNLLFSTVMFLSTYGTASSANSRLCEGYVGDNDRYHYGFYCPRLSDPAEQMHCCNPGNHSLKYCCSQLEFEALVKANLSDLRNTAVHRSPVPLLGVGCYGLLILCMMIVDFLHFCRLNKHSFYTMLNQRRIGKYLVKSILHRDPKPTPGGSDLSDASAPSIMTEPSTQEMTDIKCET